MQDKPSHGESKVYFDVEKSFEHQLNKHKKILEKKKFRIVGQDKQDELAKSVLADHDGPSKKYYDPILLLWKMKIDEINFFYDL